MGDWGMRGDEGMRGDWGIGGLRVGARRLRRKKKEEEGFKMAYQLKRKRGGLDGVGCFSIGIFTWSISQVTISKVTTSQMCYLPIGNFPNVLFTNRQLPKCTVKVRLGFL